MTVGFVVLFFKGAFVELFQAEGTDKVLRMELLGHGCDTAPCDRFLTARAQGAAALVVVHFTVRLAVVLKETSIHKRGEALPANKTLRMPKAVQCRDVIFQNGSGTATALWCKHVKVILPAISFSVLFMKPLGAKEGSTLGTKEVFRMPCSIQRRHNFIQYGPIAIVASWGEQVMIVPLTVGLPFTLEEVPGADLLLTVCAHKVFRVPCAAHGGHHLSHNWLTAGTANPFSYRLHTQFVEVRLQATKHVVKFIHLCWGPTRNANLPLGHNLKVRQRGHQLIQLSRGTGS